MKQPCFFPACMEKGSQLSEKADCISEQSEVNHPWVSRSHQHLIRDLMKNGCYYYTSTFTDVNPMMCLCFFMLVCACVFNPISNLYNIKLRTFFFLDSYLPRSPQILCFFSPMWKHLFSLWLVVSGGGGVRDKIGRSLKLDNLPNVFLSILYHHCCHMILNTWIYFGSACIMWCLGSEF